VDTVLADLAAWLEAVGYAGWARGSSSAYPLANVLHLLGLVMLVGGIGIVDLRTIGAWPTVPLAPLTRALTPVAIVGLLLLAASGSVLFAADGRALATSSTFQLKLLLVVAAVANALLFRVLWRRAPSGDPPIVARLMAATSLLLWLAVGTAGRMIAYT
jgi:hypothetical protein